MRERLDIRAGDELELAEERGRLLAAKALPDDPVDRVYGSLKVDGGSDVSIAAMRDRPGDRTAL